MDNKSITTTEFKKWVKKLSLKYRQSQIKASIKVNSEMLSFYYNLGKEISESSYKSSYGNKFFDTLSKELTTILPNVSGFSPQNLRYIEKFYSLYSCTIQKFPQLVGELFSIPWGHHRTIIDKCKTTDEALFFVKKTLENNWSRSVLSNFLETNLYKRNGKAITNFKNQLPDVNGELTQQITKDPYIFDFLSITEDYNEKELKNALIENLQKFLIELGTGFAYMGKEYRIKIGNTDEYLDLLFYNTQIHAYVVVEVKTTDFKPGDIGQLGTYVVAVDHLLKTDKDEKTIGLLVCKSKDDILARYALESSTKPLGISSYELSKIIPKNLKSSLPSIEDLESNLKG